jgi:RNA ligase (TIGR02306 family)
MSNIFVSTEIIKEVLPHPNADRLEIAKILGTQCVVPKGEYTAGQAVVYFPPDILIPPDVSSALGIQNYLKSGIYDGQKINCRVAACCLRGTSSFGFIAPLPPDCVFDSGFDISGRYRAIKYEPPVQSGFNPAWGGFAPNHPAFHHYTDIENFYRYPDAIPTGTIVRVTEKLHGTNSRVGIIDGEFMVGSHHKNLKKEFEGVLNPYWRPLEIEGIVDALNMLSAGHRNVIIFGELYGPGIQDLDYGVPAGDWGYRVFDITNDGDYLDWDQVKAICNNFGIEMVPVLYVGPFSLKMVTDLTDGPTTVCDARGIKSSFKGREGVVVTPIVEAYSPVLNGRMIIKSKSADYIGRKGAVDNA